MANIIQKPTLGKIKLKRFMLVMPRLAASTLILLMIVDGMDLTFRKVT